jgi:hypothetical protein
MRKEQFLAMSRREHFDDMMSVLYETNTLRLIYPVKQQSAGRHVAQLPIAVCLEVKQQVPMLFIVCGWTRRVLEHTIYRTRCEHANRFITDAVKFDIIVTYCQNSSWLITFSE